MLMDALLNQKAIRKTLVDFKFIVFAYSVFGFSASPVLLICGRQPLV
jgi:hypothetical protein